MALQYAKLRDALRAANVPPELADAAAEEAASRELALGEIKGALDARFAGFEAAVDLRFSKMEAQLADLRRDTKADIADLRRDTKADIKLLRWMVGVLIGFNVTLVGGVFSLVAGTFFH